VAGLRRDSLNRFCTPGSFKLIELAITPKQIVELGLPSRPVNLDYAGSREISDEMRVIVRKRKSAEYRAYVERTHPTEYLRSGIVRDPRPAADRARGH
jgi:hypothetical protein